MTDQSTDASIIDTVRHPVRLRIIQQLSGRRLTTAQLREALPEVTQATLYRHVAALVEARVLQVVDERRVRGAVERTLALGDRLAHVDQAGLRRLSDAQLRSAFLAFLADLAGGFDTFLDSDTPALRDYLGFGAGVLYVDAADLAVIQAGFDSLVAPFRQDRGDGRRRVTLATALIPDPAGDPTEFSSDGPS